jgi:hypothetical protein
LRRRKGQLTEGESGRVLAFSVEVEDFDDKKMPVRFVAVISKEITV